MNKHQNHKRVALSMLLFSRNAHHRDDNTYKKQQNESPKANATLLIRPDFDHFANMAPLQRVHVIDKPRRLTPSPACDVDELDLRPSEGDAEHLLQLELPLLRIESDGDLVIVAELGVKRAGATHADRVVEVGLDEGELDG